LRDFVYDKALTKSPFSAILQHSLIRSTFEPSLTPQTPKEENMFIPSFHVGSILLLHLEGIEHEPKYLEICEFTLLATLVHEIAFRYEAAGREEGWSMLETFLQAPSGDLKDEHDRARVLVESMNMDQDREPAIIDHDLFYLRSRFRRPSLLEWLKEAWQAGVHQRQVYECEIEGSIQNRIGVVTNLAAHLSLEFSRDPNYLT
jgi:hypothetical protein